MAGTPVDNVSDTAFWVAYYRGLEGERPDALFRDPLALRLAGEHGKKIARAIPGAHFTSWTVVLRTCIIDDYIRRAAAEGVDTVLNLGAGLCTRPYRIELPAELNWIEVDFPALVAFKEERLAGEIPRCKLSRVKLDLADKAERDAFLARVNAGSKKLVVLTEGVTPYLSEDEVASLASELRGLDRAAFWIVDYYAPLSMKYRPRRMMKVMQNAPFKFFPDDWFAFFQRYGWRAREMRYLSEEAESRKRPLASPLWMKALWAIRRPSMPKAEREGFKTAVGYALLEPIREGA